MVVKVIRLPMGLVVIGEDLRPHRNEVSGVRLCFPGPWLLFLTGEWLLKDLNKSLRFHNKLI